ncbi:MAG: hypothetical protein HY914_06655 [Desulfomonile tiedjei]|nr:hypothetical protein [Desulfomonile tiedjei]
MSETAHGKKIAPGNGSDREMLEESDVENRWTPVALKLAVNLSEEATAAAGPTEDRGDQFDAENRWTPVALKLVMSGEDKS